MVAMWAGLGSGPCPRPALGDLTNTREEGEVIGKQQQETVKLVYGFPDSLAMYREQINRFTFEFGAREVREIWKRRVVVPRGVRWLHPETIDIFKVDSCHRCAFILNHITMHGNILELCPPLISIRPQMKWWCRDPGAVLYTITSGLSLWMPAPPLCAARMDMFSGAGHQR